MKSILIKLAGPLQSWGTRSHFETRHTDFYPSKSAIIGMIAASLGYHRDEDDYIQKLNELDFAVRVDQQGNLLRDYHTAKKYKNDGRLDRTYVTNRYYLEDAVFLIAIGHENDEWIDQIHGALENPYYQLFMGRRSLPLQADYIIGTSSKNVIEALCNQPWHVRNWKKEKQKKRLFIYADSHLLPGKEMKMNKDYVLSFSQKERRFAYRSVSKIQIEVDEYTQTTDHDAFDAIGG